MCFNVVQNERGLSVHFLIDNDGTIYQTIDLGLMAYHASEWNIDSIGVEMCNKGDAKTYPGLYQTGPFRRDLKTCKINEHAILAYDYTKAQYDSFDLLCRALQRLLPNLPAEFPQSTPGKQHWGTIPKDVSTRFAGYIGHYHLWDQKWDPGPFEFEPFCRRLRGSFCYPVFPTPKGEPKKTEERPAIPEQSDELVFCGTKSGRDYDKFAELGSVHRTVQWFRHAGLSLPVIGFLFGLFLLVAVASGLLARREWLQSPAAA
jgi:hypothetical protein